MTKMILIIWIFVYGGGSADSLRISRPVELATYSSTETCDEALKVWLKSDKAARGVCLPH